MTNSTATLGETPVALIIGVEMAVLAVHAIVSVVVWKIKWLETEDDAYTLHHATHVKSLVNQQHEFEEAQKENENFLKKSEESQ